MPFTWIDTPLELAAVARLLSSSRRVAVDVEADTLYRYRGKTCLLQVSTGEMTFLIDTLALTDLSCLQDVMTNPAVEKVFHAAVHDIAWLRRDHGLGVSTLFDTQIAAQLLGYVRHGLDFLLESLLGVVHSKQFQRSDWSRRPLSPEQRGYAALDAHYLLPLRDVLEAMLLEKGRLAWALEEFDLLTATYHRPVPFDPEGYRRVKGIRGLTARQRSILRAVWGVREHAAQEMDLPAVRVMNNAVMLVIARRCPRTPGQLDAAGVPRQVVERYGERLVAAIDEAHTAGPEAVRCLPRTRMRPMPEVIRRIRMLKAWRAERAGALGLPVGVLLPNGVLNAIARTCPQDEESLQSIEGMRRWRVKEFGEEILRLISE